jgi:hypothetical protein
MFLRIFRLPLVALALVVTLARAQPASPSAAPAPATPAAFPVFTPEDYGVADLTPAL